MIGFDHDVPFRGVRLFREHLPTPIAEKMLAAAVAAVGLDRVR